VEESKYRLSSILHNIYSIGTKTMQQESMTVLKDLADAANAQITIASPTIHQCYLPYQTVPLTANSNVCEHSLNFYCNQNEQPSTLCELSQGE
jgi:hypothetical protein